MAADGGEADGSTLLQSCAPGTVLPSYPRSLMYCWRRLRTQAKATMDVSDTQLYSAPVARSVSFASYGWFTLTNPGITEKNARQTWRRSSTNAAEEQSLPMRRLSARRTGPVAQTDRPHASPSAARGKDMLRVGPCDMSVVQLPPIKGSTSVRPTSNRPISTLMMQASPVAGLAFSRYMRPDKRSAVDATRELRRALPELYQFAVDARTSPRTQPASPPSWQQGQLAPRQPLLASPRRPSTPTLTPISASPSPRSLASPGRSLPRDHVVKHALKPHPPSSSPNHRSYRQEPSPRRPPLPSIRPPSTAATAAVVPAPAAASMVGAEQMHSRGASVDPTSRATVGTPAISSQPPRAPAPRSTATEIAPPMATGSAAQPMAQLELAELAGQFWSGIHHALSPQALDMQWAAIKHAVACC